MTPEKQAALIAEWLEQPPGTPPPEGVDPDALEAIYAFKPELAPAPRVSIDDILTGVGEGPFFEAKVAELPLAREEQPAVGGSVEPPVAEQPEAPPQEAQVIDLAARRRRRIWGGVGVAAMAALVLFSIAPEDGFENMADAPMPAEQMAPLDDLVALEDAGEMQQQAKDAPLEAPTAKQQAAKPSASTTSAVPEPEPAQLAQEWEAPPAPPAEPEAAEAKAEAPATGRYDQLELSAGGASYGDDPTAVTGNTAYDADPGYFEEAEEEVLADEGVATQSIAESVSRKTAERVAPSKKSERRRTRGESGSGAASSAAPAVADAEFDYSTDDAGDYVEEPIPTDLDGLRAAAVPADYSSSWYLRSLGDEELDRFDKAIETGTESDLISDPNVLIGQDMAYRAAKKAMGSNDSQALSWVRAGQKRSSANTAFLANLYYLKGRILERQGDTEAAKRAYTTAANLNRAR